MEHIISEEINFLFILIIKRGQITAGLSILGYETPVLDLPQMPDDF